MSPDMAQAARRAAALYIHWRRDDHDPEGELTVLDELDTDLEQWANLLFALLNVGCGMANAARDGAEAEYLACVVREASLDEALQTASDDLAKGEDRP